MVVHHDHVLTVDVEGEGSGDVAGGNIVDALLVLDGVAAQQGYHTCGIGANGVVIGVLAIEQTVYLGLFAASGHGFLQTHDVGMGIHNVTDGRTLAFLLTVVVIAAHIVGKDFEGIVGWCGRQIEGTVGARGLIAHYETGYGQEAPSGVEQQPKDEEGQIDGKQGGVD